MTGWKKQYRQLQQASDELASFTFISQQQHQTTHPAYLHGHRKPHQNGSRPAHRYRQSLFRRRIQSSISKMDLLLDDMLSLARISTLEKPETLVDIDSLFAEVIDTLRPKIEERGVEVVLENLCAVAAHKKQLHVLFEHLMGIAIRFGEGRPPLVRIECSKEWASEFPAVALSEREYYRISISYQGAGSELADTEKGGALYEKPHADKFKNSGIGLAIARKIMNAHDGFLRVESCLEGNACFYCFFPVNSI